MMYKLEQKLREDKLLRDAARTLFDADIERVRGDLEAKSVGARALARAKDGAAEMLDTAGDKAGSNLGIIAILAGVIVLWFARNPILALFGSAEEEDEDLPQPDHPIGDDT